MGIRSRLKSLLFGQKTAPPPPEDLPEPGVIVRQTGKPKPPPEKYRTTRAPEKKRRKKKKKEPEAAPVNASAGLPDVEAQKLAKQQKAVERAKKGTLTFLIDAGGTSELAAMHDHSERRYFIAHRAFSRLMEDLTQSGLVDFDHGTGSASITQAGRDYVS